MKLGTFRIELESLSPILITAVEGYRGFLYRSLRYYIPGTVVQGSIFTAAINEGLVNTNEVLGIVNKELVSTTPALVTIDFSYKYLRDVGIAHALCLKPKIKSKKVEKGEIFSIDVGKIINELIVNPMDFQGSVKRVLSTEVANMVRTLEVPVDLEDCSGKATLRKNGKWFLTESVNEIRVLPKTYVSIAVKDWGGTVPGALYAYEYIERGVKFMAYTSCIKNSRTYNILKQLESIGNINLRVGKATSRGLGMVRAKITEYPIENLIHEIGVNEISIGDRIIVLESLSLASILDPLPRPINVGDEISDRLGLGLRLKVIGVLESKYGTREYRGWSIATNTPKITVKGLPSGSLIFTKVIKLPSSPNNLHNALISLLLLGIEPHIHGFNIMYPFKKDPYHLDVR